MPRSRALSYVLALGTLAAGLVLAQALPLIDPDEGRNAEIAREMAVSGDPVIPTLAGMPYLDKPPGFFWASSLAVRAFGPRPWAARLPAAVASALIVFAVAQAAARRHGDAFAARAALLLAWAPLFTMLSAYVIFDMALALCVTLVWLGIARETESGVSRWTRALMFAAVAAGVLIKGPVMLAWALGGSLGAAVLLRSRAPLRWLGWLPGWLIVVTLAGGWFLLACLRHPEYPRYAFVEESLERLTTRSFHRDQPLWFVPAVLVGGALPWSLATPWSRRVGVSGRIGLGFVAFAAIFFSLSHSKLVTYLVPVLPPLAWLAAEAWDDPNRARRGGLLAGALFMLLAFGLVIAASRMPATAPPGSAAAAFRLAGAFALLGGLATVAVASGREALAWVPLVPFTPVVLVCAAGPLLGYASAESGGPLAAAIGHSVPGGRVRYEFCYSPGTDFLLGRISGIVSADGHETTSIYQARYRERLIARGQWSLLDHAPAQDSAAVVVRKVTSPDPPPAHGVEFFRDRRFVAYTIATGAGTR